jgi:putative cardiolipin synthase
VLLFPELIRTMAARASLDIVSPYFVPGDEGTAALTEMARRGVRVRILTNSLAASDVGVVHAGYMKRRRDLLLAGVSLYELKATATSALDAEQPRRIERSVRPARQDYAVDGAKIFVGSFNFDPRSARLNTELGFVVDSAVLAGRLAATFDTVIPQRAYEVASRPRATACSGSNGPPAGEEQRHDHEPETSGFKRWGVQMLSIPADRVAALRRAVTVPAVRGEMKSGKRSPAPSRRAGRASSREA